MSPKVSSIRRGVGMLLFFFIFIIALAVAFWLIMYIFPFVWEEIMKAIHELTAIEVLHKE